jgi:hypothetical protein
LTAYLGSPSASRRIALIGFERVSVSALNEQGAGVIHGQQILAGVRNIPNAVFTKPIRDRIPSKVWRVDDRSTDMQLSGLHATAAGSGELRIFSPELDELTGQPVRTLLQP